MTKKEASHKLKVYISKDVRKKLQDILSDGEETFGISFCDDPKKCSTEIFLDIDEEKVDKALQEKRVPILPENGIYEDFDPIEERGVAFTYNPNKPFSIFDALVRARENHRFSYDWQNIIKQGQKLAAAHSD